MLSLTQELTTSQQRERYQQLRTAQLSLEVGKAFMRGWEIFRSNLKRLSLYGFLYIAVIFIFAATASTLLFSGIAFTETGGLDPDAAFDPAFSLISIVVQLGSYVAISPLFLGFCLVIAKMGTGQPHSFNDFFYGYRYTLHVIGLYLLIIICVYGGLITLIIPGLIMMMGAVVSPFMLLYVTKNLANIIKLTWRIGYTNGLNIFFLSFLISLAAFGVLIPIIFLSSLLISLSEGTAIFIGSILGGILVIPVYVLITPFYLCMLYAAFEQFAEQTGLLDAGLDLDYEKEDDPQTTRF